VARTHFEAARLVLRFVTHQIDDEGILDAKDGVGVEVFIAAYEQLVVKGA
jgi:hypothetical protein